MEPRKKTAPSSTSIKHFPTLAGKILRRSDADAPPRRGNTWRRSLPKFARTVAGVHTLYILLCVCMWAWNSCDETSPGPKWQSLQNVCTVFTHAPSWLSFPAQTGEKKTLSLPLSFQIFLFNTRFARFLGFFLFFFTPQYANLSWSIKLQLLPSWIGDRDFNSCAQIEFLQREQAQEIVSIRGKRWIKAIKLDTNGPMRMMTPDLTH